MGFNRGVDSTVGWTGKGIPEVLDALTKESRKKSVVYGQTGGDADTVALLDAMWDMNEIGSYNPRSDNSYFDYYFSGQDIMIFIDGAPENTAMPIIDFAFNVQQQKTPVYGAFSYTYDGVMRGTRLISGAFRIATTTIDYMTNQIAWASATRASQSKTGVLRPHSEDEANIERYWKSKDYSKKIPKAIFSSHPPFNFIIVYGIQSASLADSTNTNIKNVMNTYQNSAMMLDTNERLTEASPSNNKMRWMLDSVELMSMQTEYTSDGQVVAETYQFFARDCYSVQT